MLGALSIRKFMSMLFVGFLLFFVATSPVEAGNMVHSIATSLSDVFVSMANAFSEFLKTVF